VWTMIRPNSSRYDWLLVVINILLHRFFQLLNTTFKYSETWFEIVDSILERVQHAQYSLLYINTGALIRAMGLMTHS